MSLKRFAALMLCAALALCLLAGCGGAGTDASSEAAPSEQAQASASGLLPEEDENSLVLTDPSGAFASALGWDGGTAGTSLKAVIAAADMLAWAEDNNLSRQSQTAAKTLLENWYDGLTEIQKEGLAEAWPLIKNDAQLMLTDKDSIAGLIEDAGLKAEKLPGCTQANWEALAALLDEIVPEPAQ